MTKKLCDLKKLRKRNPDKYLRLVDEPAYGCERCERVANSKKRVCRPFKLKRPK